MEGFGRRQIDGDRAVEELTCRVFYREVYRDPFGNLRVEGGAAHSRQLSHDEPPVVAASETCGSNRSGRLNLQVPVGENHLQPTDDDITVFEAEATVLRPFAVVQRYRLPDVCVDLQQ